MDEENLVIVTQNMKGFFGGDEKDWIKDRTGIVCEFLKSTDADIIAAQELPVDIDEAKEASIQIEGIKRSDRDKFFTGFYTKNEKYIGKESMENAKIIWEDVTKYCTKLVSFRSGLWVEKVIKYQNYDIRIINIHIAPSREVEMRLSLIRYLQTVSEEFVIVLGDFNAFRNWQTQGRKYHQNESFFDDIEKMGFVELFQKDESGNTIENESCPQYTHYEKSGGRKLDHILLSKSMYNQFNYTIEYLSDNDNSKRIFENQKPCKKAFSDHTGIKVNLKVKANG